MKCHRCTNMLGYLPLASDVQEVVLTTTPSTPQVGNREALNCYYAHADQEDQLQVDCLLVRMTRPFDAGRTVCVATAVTKPHRSLLSAGSHYIRRTLQRRCYWMLEGDDSIVLVHYLAGNAAARLRHPGAVPLTAANLAMQPRNMEVCSCRTLEEDAEM